MIHEARDKWRCDPCRKTAYGSEGRGWDAIRTILRLEEDKRTPIVPCRVYECPYGNGWHLTHIKDKSETSEFRYQRRRA